METVKISDPNVLERATQVLQNGGVVAYPSETCYGFLANYHDESAIRKIYKLKNRPFEKQFLVIVSDLEEVKKIAILTPLAEKLAQKFWPGALTLVLPSEENTLAVRVPAHDFSQKLLQECGLPLVSTSANLSGEDNPYTAEQVAKLEPDLLIDAGEITPEPPTTIVDCTGEKPKILRLGKIGKNDLEDAE